MRRLEYGEKREVEGLAMRDQKPWECLRDPFY
jgi:hypothetical protein